MSLISLGFHYIFFVEIDFNVRGSAEDKTHTLTITKIGFCDEKFKYITDLAKIDCSVELIATEYKDTVEPLAVAG